VEGKHHLASQGSGRAKEKLLALTVESIAEHSEGQAIDSE